LAAGAQEQPGVLEHRRRDLAVAGALEDLPRALDHAPACAHGPGQPVERAAGRLEGVAQRARTASRNGFVARSRPSVVEGPWPGWIGTSSPTWSYSPRIDCSSTAQDEPGKSVRPTAPAKSA